MNLSGKWLCALDRDNVGLREKWHGCLPSHAVPVELPGSLAAQRIGDKVTLETQWTGTIFDRSFFDSPRYAPFREPDNIKLPFWLQPEKVFVGAAWYQREIEIPPEWSGKNVVLTLERPHWQTRVWLDDREIGACDSLSTPHVFDLGEIPPGRYLLTIRVDNRLQVEIGENAHSVSDQTQGNWNGIIGDLMLAVREDTRIADLQIFPHDGTRSITVRGLVKGAAPANVDLRIGSHDATARADILPDGTFSAEVALGDDAPLWDEFSPNLWQLTALLENGEARKVSFGLREIAVDGRQLTVNGRPLFLRGVLDCCIFPRTGHPPMDVEPWRHILRTIQAHGLNHIRFHSWCPPEAAFVAGDELGVFFQVECAVWPNSVAVFAFNSPAGIGDGNSVDRWTYEEGERILRAYGNHPCFVLMACGNEPGGPHHKEFLSGWVRHFRERDPRRLYTGTAGWPELPENDFNVIPEPRVHQWGDGLNCRINGQPPATTHDYRAVIEARDKPVIAHENGQWCAYPPVYDAGKYTGHLRARNYQIFSGSLDANGMADQARDFVQSSGKLQAICYKEEIESALRTPAMAGFQLLGLQDFPGQGTAPVGIADAFWESKGYLTADEMHRFCGATVPLARLPKRVFTTDEKLEAEIEVAHYGPSPLTCAAATWQLVSESGLAVESGELPVHQLTPGSIHLLGRIQVSLRDRPAPARYRLVVSIASFENDWDVWVYASQLKPSVPSGVSVVHTIEEAAAALQSGGLVLLVPDELASDIALGFSPIFWNTACTQGQAPHTLGILCDPHHSALKDFPTENYSNWQWWYLLRRAKVMKLDGLPANLRPIVQVIDDWFTNRRLGLLFEACVGAGKLLVCSMPVTENDREEIVSRQFFASLLQYMGSHLFQPAVSLSIEELGAALR